MCAGTHIYKHTHTSPNPEAIFQANQIKTSSLSETRSESLLGRTTKQTVIVGGMPAYVKNRSSEFSHGDLGRLPGTLETV